MPAAPPNLRVRPAGGDDEPFMWRQLALTARLPPAEPPPVESVKADPGMMAYLTGWGRPGDRGVIAEVDGEPVGAAWFRLFDAGHPGYGFVDAQIPEISIAVQAAWCHRGVGRALVEALVEAARSEGHNALSLSVDAQNVPALALYRSVGFVETAGGSPENPTMLLRLVG